MSDEESQEEQLTQLVYVSAACVPFNDEQLDELLAIARRNNGELDVTGVLLYQDGTFFQVLEGAPEAVQALYGKIERDPRHNNVLLLARRMVGERNFGEWRMGFVRERRDIEELPGFVNFFERSTVARTFMDLHGDADRIREILEGFRRGRWRREAAT